MKKPKYKEIQRTRTWVVIADYQPGSMWSRPEDRKTSRHETMDEAMNELNKHQEAGASTIELLHAFFTLEQK